MSPVRSHREAHRQSLYDGLLQYGTEKIGLIGVACGVEARMPFMDRRVLEFCLALPASQKLHHGWNRVIMRRAMGGLLPPEVQWRLSKGDLSRNIRRGLLEARPALEEVILGDARVIEPYIDLSALRAAYARFASHPLESLEADVFTILSAFTLVKWLDKSGIAV